MEHTTNIWDPTTAVFYLSEDGSTAHVEMPGEAVIIEGETARMRAWASDLIERIDCARAARPELFDLDGIDEAAAGLHAESVERSRRLHPSRGDDQ